MRNSRVKLKNLIKAASFVLIFILIMQLVMFVAVPNNVISKRVMEDFYNTGHLDMTFVGSSTVSRTINAPMLDDQLNIQSFDLATNSAKYIDNFYMIRELYRVSSSDTVFISLPVMRLQKTWIDYEESLIIGSKLVFDYMQPSQVKLEYYLNAFPDDFRINALFPGLELVNAQSFNMSQLKNNIKNKITDPQMTTGWDDEYQYGGRGYIATDRTFSTEQAMSDIDLLAWSESDVDQESLDYLKKSIELCQAHGSKVVLFAPPMPAIAFAQTGNYQGFHQYATALAQSYGVDFLDFNYAKPKFFKAETKYFYDARHMNREGATVFTKALAAFLPGYLNGSYEMDKYFFSSYAESINARSRK